MSRKIERSDGGWKRTGIAARRGSMATLRRRTVRSVTVRFDQT
ncbi:MAG TPA: hypothetical protein VN731_11495 [Rhodanobacter sp.]|nr:hypothetical protein [Rhodanobacter sp.]